MGASGPQVGFRSATSRYRETENDAILAGCSRGLIPIRTLLLNPENVFLELADLNHLTLAFEMDESKHWKWQPRYRRLPKQAWHGTAIGHLSLIKVKRRIGSKRSPLTLG